MPRTAQAPIFPGDGAIRLVQRTYRDPGEGELLISPRANAICGTDRGMFLGGATHIPGHETAGVVISAGPGSSTPTGTRGVTYLMDFCGACRSCLIGATNQCLAKRGDMGINTDGGYGPFEVIHESNFFPISDDIDFETATMLLDVMGTSSHAIGRAQLVRPDIESVYIAGAGPIGLGLVVMAKLRLGEDLPVYISDISPWRREFAASFGAIPVDAADPSALRAIGRPDIAFDASGKEVARRAALDILAQRGALICAGHGEGISLSVSDDLIAPEHAVLGSEYFRYDELAGNLELLQKHQDVVSRIVTHTFPIEDLDQAFAAFLSGETGKVVVTQEGIE
jgi:threonine 3-dehydrogenase